MTNYIRREVEAMDWSDVIADPEGDRAREVARLRRQLIFWRRCALLMAMLTGMAAGLIWSLLSNCQPKTF